MKVNAILVLCAQACFLQFVIGQCLNRAGIAGGLPGLAYDGLAIGAGLSGLAFDGLALGTSCGGVASTGGGFPITSASPVPPTGIKVVSENLYEGGLFVEGNLPLLGSVGLTGAMGSTGAGAVSYGCGDGAVGIAVEEGPIVTGILAPGAAGPGIGALGLGIGGLGYGAGLASGPGLIGAGIAPGCGCGYGALY